MRRRGGTGRWVLELGTRKPPNWACGKAGSHGGKLEGEKEGGKGT